MPQKSKKPIEKAKRRASSTAAKSKRSAAKASPKGVRRSVAAKAKRAPTPKAKRAPTPKAKLKSPGKPPKVAARPEAKRAKQAPRKPSLVAEAKPKALSPKPELRTRHALILPPRPKRLDARLLVAPAPRAARVEESPLHSSPTTARGSATTARGSATTARVSTKPTREVWRAIEAMADELGRAPLNDEQRVAIRTALEGHDSVVVLPDDERRVSCYQLAAFQLTQPTVVISPVPAELQAQQAALSARGLPVLFVSAELGVPARNAALARISRGGALLLLLTPEELRAPDIRQALTKSGIALFVAEEAHCASNAAHELRPSYTELGVTLRGLGSPPVMAITRVASAAVRRDIRERLELEAPVTIQSPKVRENVQLVTKLARGEGRQAALVRLVERLTLPGLVFCATPHDVDSVYAALRGAGIAAHRHHSGMTASDRAAELSNFNLPGQRALMVAVSAFAPGSGLPGIGELPEASLGFGRGPGRRDLRFVVHYQSPASIEQYLREIQGAGADGAPAMCVLLHESSHRSLHEVMLAQQRVRATHLAELGRALETPALEARPVSIEALALGTGQSRRSTDRLSALLADAGVVSRTAGWVRVLCTASELDEACRRLGAQLYALREQDARRLASVSAFAEASECKLSCLNQYLGEGASQGCGRCSACVSDLLAPTQESLVPQTSARRGVVHEFSVQPVSSSVHALSAPLSGVVLRGAQPDQGALTAKLADFGVAGSPRE
jgi:ATP-dependent DNA helicase RecQ